LEFGLDRVRIMLSFLNRELAFSDKKEEGFRVLFGSHYQTDLSYKGDSIIYLKRAFI
jgi:hypothetical protein